jgi:hypothetical protein
MTRSIKMISFFLQSLWLADWIIELGKEEKELLNKALNIANNNINDKQVEIRC